MMFTLALALALPIPVVTTGTFQPFHPGSTAITYDTAAVPAGATAAVTIARTGYGTDVKLTVTGLVAGRTYGAHLHTNPCTAVPEEAGPHYQNHPDPVTPSTNPVYANPRNEIWLDFTADATGAATSAVTHGWNFRPTAPPRSLVLHAEHTHTAPGEAGKAGARLACLTL
jgi:superoxide dismutase, Cu-Zn family